VYHSAALYEIGTKDAARMERINVGGTENVLGAAAERDVPAVYVSSVVALGPTGSSPADETHWSGTAPRSAYEATKRAAHELARRLAKVGAPLRIALPSTIYGPDDPSLVGITHRMFTRGLLRVGAFSDREMSMVHVDDCAEGLVLIADKGTDGEEYILCERVVTFREWFELLGRVSRRRGPALYLPDWVVERFGPLTARAAPLAGFSPELVREGLAMAGRWAFSGDRARRELGWRPRSFEAGLSETMAWYRAAASAQAERRSEAG
jgi:nucleoside-diphosphate-sugar epimerase